MAHFSGSGTPAPEHAFNVTAPAAGLSNPMGDFAGPLRVEQFNGGQISRWTRQYQASINEPVADTDRLTA